MTRIGRLVALVVLVLAVGIAGLTAVKLVRDHRADERGQAVCDQVTDLNTKRHDQDVVSTGDVRATILGDSYAQGQFLDDPRDEAWSTLASEELGWETTVDAVGGTGFVSDGPCGGQSIAERAPAAIARDKPDVLVVQAGLNDLPEDATAAALAEVVGEAGGDARVIVLGPTSPPRYDAQRALDVDALLAAASKTAGAEYVSALAWDLDYLDDGLHMTRQSHAQYADLFVEAVR